MLKFKTKILKAKPDQNSWSYIILSKKQIDNLNPPNRRSFRIKGFLDKFPITFRSLLPLGDGRFILPINAEMRKGTGKKVGDQLDVALTLDTKRPRPSAEFVACLKDDPLAYANFKKLNRSQQLFYSGWIRSAKTVETKTRRIALAIKGLAEGRVFGVMLKDNQASKIPGSKRPART